MYGASVMYKGLSPAPFTSPTVFRRGDKNNFINSSNIM